MRKQFMAVLLAGSLALTAAACTSGDTKKTEKTTAAATVNESAADTTAAEDAEKAETGAADTTAAEDAEKIETEAETIEEPYDYSAAFDEKGFYKDVAALEYVTLPEGYTAMEVPASAAVPSSEKIEEAVDSKIAAFITTEQLTEGVVEDGDTINIDYVGSIDGVEFEGGNTHGNGTNVTIGVTSYIDDFLEQLIGHKIGETVNVEVTFPENYGKEDLNGKDALFVVTINSKSHTIIPELTDEFVKEKFEFDTVEEFKKDIYDSLMKNNIRSYVMSRLVSESEKKDAPESVAEAVYQDQYLYIASMVQYYGMDIETYLSYQQMTLDDLKVYSAALAKNNLVYQAVAEDQKLELSDEKVMEMVGMDEEAFGRSVDLFGKGYIYNSMIPQLVADYLAEKAVVVEEEAEEIGSTEEAAETGSTEEAAEESSEAAAEESSEAVTEESETAEEVMTTEEAESVSETESK